MEKRVMPLEEELAQFRPEKDMLLTVGVFEGVHLGHKYLISQLTTQARQQNLLSGVVTFRQHPREVLSSQTELTYLTNLTEKINLLKNEGVDAVIALSFTQEVAQCQPRQFVGLLQKYLRMRGLVVGPGFALGRKREGNVDALRQLGQEMNFSVTVVTPKRENGEIVSSTAIRQALADGDIKKANRLLGRTFSLQGQVVTGRGRGGPQLGFPTINLEVAPNQAIPANGVYVTLTHIDGKTFPSMTNIGHRPTFGENERTIETYIINYEGNLYGHEVKIDIIERLRGEKRFNSAEELKKQISEDIKRGQDILASRDKSEAQNESR